MNIPDHPDIVWCERTGYTQDNQPESHYCQECGECLDDEEIYEDSSHEYLCESCLRSIYKKWW